SRCVYAKPAVSAVRFSLGAGTNLSFRRAALQRAGGFDVALGAGTPARGGAEADLIARVLRDGGTIVRDPRAVCWTRPPRTMTERCRRAFDYGFGVAACHGKLAADIELANLSIRHLHHWASDLIRNRDRLPLQLALLQL